MGQIDKSFLRSLAHDLWMLGEKTRHVGYSLLLDKARKRGQVTLADVYSRGTLEDLRDNTDYFKNKGDSEGSEFNLTNFIHNYNELKSLHEKVCTQLDQLLEKIKKENL